MGAPYYQWLSFDRDPAGKLILAAGQNSGAYMDQVRTSAPTDLSIIRYVDGTYTVQDTQQLETANVNTVSLTSRGDSRWSLWYTLSDVLTYRGSDDGGTTWSAGVSVASTIARGTSGALRFFQMAWDPVGGFWVYCDGIKLSTLTNPGGVWQNGGTPTAMSPIGDNGPVFNLQRWPDGTYTSYGGQWVTMIRGLRANGKATITRLNVTTGTAILGGLHAVDPRTGWVIALPIQFGHFPDGVAYQPIPGTRNAGTWSFTFNRHSYANLPAFTDPPWNQCDATIATPNAGGIGGAIRMRRDGIPEFVYDDKTTGGLRWVTLRAQSSDDRSCFFS